MNIEIFETATEMGEVAGKHAARTIKEAIAKNGVANVIFATGASQFETIQHILADKDIEWEKVVMFHLDEYLGLSIEHPASFRKYIQERFLDQLPPLKAYYLINGEVDTTEELQRLKEAIEPLQMDLGLIGIGENGHLAFNDPPADFETNEPYLVVNLDEGCRRQQLGEGWFSTLDEVPRQAISMSVNQILKTKILIASIPDERKARAVKNCLENEVSPLYPASILQTHEGCYLYLDKAAASLLERK